MFPEALHTKVRVICTDPDATESSSDDEASLTPKRLVHEICLPARSSGFWAADCGENWSYGALRHGISRPDVPSVSKVAESSSRRRINALGRKRSCKAACQDGDDARVFNFAPSSGSSRKPQNSHKVKNARRVSRLYRRVRQRRWESPDGATSRICGRVRSGASRSSASSCGAEQGGLCSAYNRERYQNGRNRTAKACEDFCLRECCEAYENLGSPIDDAEGSSSVERGPSSCSNSLGDCRGDSPSSVLESPPIVLACVQSVPLPPVNSPSVYLSEISEDSDLQPNLYAETDVPPSVSSNRVDNDPPFAQPEPTSDGVCAVVTPIVENFPLFLAEFGQLFSFADAENCEIAKSLALDSFDYIEEDTDITDISLDFDSEALTWINASEICVV